MQSYPVKIVAGVLVTLAFFALIAYIVRVLARSEATARRLAGTLTAIAGLLTALCGVLYTIYGGWPPAP